MFGNSYYSEIFSMYVSICAHIGINEGILWPVSKKGRGVETVPNGGYRTRRTHHIGSEELKEH